MRKLLFFLLFSLNLHALFLLEKPGELKEEVQAFVALFNVPDFPIDDLVSYVQQHWLQKNKERWEMKNAWEEKWEKALPLLEKIGCINTIHASGKKYTYALVLGATGRVMQNRLDTLYEEWKRGVRFQQIVLLAGDRDLDPSRETFPENLRTETDLLAYLFEKHPLKDLASHILICAPKKQLEDGTWRRPSTACTILKWLETDPEPGNCLAVSTQPFVGYQEAVLRLLLPQTFTVEGIGQETIYFPMGVYLDNFAKWIQYEVAASKNLPYPPW